MRNIGFHALISPILNYDGSINCFTAIERDITKQKEIEETLFEQAGSDPLTKTLNRRRSIELADEAIYRCQRQKSQFAILLIDIDDFKVVNDTKGHMSGDDVLVKVAQHCKNYSRLTDRVCRYGGDEFIILLSDINHQDLVNKAQRLCLEINNDADINVTVSIGASLSTANDKSFSALFKRADDALYEAKSKGKNQVVFHVSQ